MYPKYFEFFNPVKINAGEGALEGIPAELQRLNVSKPFIITDKGIVSFGLLNLVLDGFNDSDIVIGAIYDDVPPDSSIEVVNEAASIYKREACDCIIAVGGGSVIDSAKGMNIVISENTEDITQFSGHDRLRNFQQPLIVVPTTSGTGSEVTLVSVVADKKKNRKILFTSTKLLPTLAVIDPRMTLSLPPKLTAATGMDALTHAVEAFSCLQKNPISDAYAFSAIKTISENIFNVVTDGSDVQGRFELAVASTSAGVAFSNAMVGAVHGIGHTVGALAHVHHGMAMSILLPYVMEYNLDKVGDYYADLLLPLAGDEVYASTPVDKRPQESINYIKGMNEKLNKLCGMPISLKDAGVKEEQLIEIAEKSLNDGAMIVNPVDMNKEEVLSILKKAF
ncbi:MAG: iron-containing alcohol dehydrogenase [Flavobacteriales bacterium]|nr:iron-containing alcohol dehydrogenase [Flavobacteriales bacterium]